MTSSLLFAARASAALVALALLVGGCSDMMDSNARSSTASCQDLLDRTVTLVRSGQKGNGHDALSRAIQALSDADCPHQSSIFSDYMSSRSMVDQIGRESCRSWRRYIDPAAIRLLHEDGLCRMTRRARPPQHHQGGGPGGISWQEAASHARSVQKVCGPLAGTGMSDDDFFLNVGRDYPDPQRFTIVLWDVGSVQPPPLGATVCATGPIVLYQGVAQIQVRSVGAVEVYR